MLMAKRSHRHLAMLLFVTAPKEAARVMSSRCAAPHHGSGCFSSPSKEAEYMAATVLPHISNRLASGLGPYMTDGAHRRTGRRAPARAALPASWCLVAEHDGAAAREHAADTHARPRFPRQAPARARSPQLPDALLQGVHPIHPRVHVGETAAVRVERERPPGAVWRSRMKAAASPGSQKPRSSSP